VRDLADRSAAGELGHGLVLLDALLRWTLAAAWLAAAAAELPVLFAAPAPARVALAGCGLAALAGLRPRPVCALGLAASLLALPGPPALAPWLALLGAAAARLWLRSGPSGALLQRVDALRRRRARCLLATELHRARAAALPEGEREGELTRAGDAFEQAGHARRELAALGVGVRAASPVARAGGRILTLLPGPWLEKLEERSI